MKVSLSPSLLFIANLATPEVLLTMKLDFEQIVLLIMTTSWITVIAGLCLEHLAPKKSNKKKKKGGGGGGGGGSGPAVPGREGNKVNSV